MDFKTEVEAANVLQTTYHDLLSEIGKNFYVQDDIVHYSPDIEDMKKVAIPILRHRIVKNHKAEAQGVRVEGIIELLRLGETRWQNNI